MNILWIVMILVLVTVVLYLLAIMPRMTGKPDVTPLLNRLYAHRGLHNNATEAPENSMKAFQKAVDAGYGIEMDIQLTKDNIPVVFHDFDLKRICGAEGMVRDYTYEELQQFKLCKSEERIPLFADVLKLVDGKVPLIVEFKNESTDMTLCPIADELLKAYKGVYCMESFNPLCVHWYRKHRKDVVRGQLSEAFWKEGKDRRTVLYFCLQHLLLNFLAKPDFVAYDHHHPHMLSRVICRKLYGNLAVAWTIRSQKELEEAKKHFDLYIFDSFIPE